MLVDDLLLPGAGAGAGGALDRNYQPGFSAGMMLKDLRLAQDAATGVKAATPLGAAAEQLYTLMEAAGADSLDFSGIIKLIQGNLTK